MSQTQVILLERVDHLGQMGDVVSVKPGYARNFLLPQRKALRANAENRKHFEAERAQLEAQNLKRREEAERLAERMQGLDVVLIRQAGDSGSLYGSVTTRDIAAAVTAAGLSVGRNQIILAHPIKMLGLTEAKVALHPEVFISLTVNVARSEEEAERQARGEAIAAEEDDYVLEVGSDAEADDVEAEEISA